MPGNKLYEKHVDKFFDEFAMQCASYFSSMQGSSKKLMASAVKGEKLAESWDKAQKAIRDMNPRSSLLDRKQIQKLNKLDDDQTEYTKTLRKVADEIDTLISSLEEARGLLKGTLAKL